MMPSRPILLLTAGIAIVGINGLLLSPISAAIARSFHGSQAPDVMVAAAIYGLGTAFSALTLAPLADRVGADRVLLSSIVGLVVALALSGVAPELWLLCLAQGAVGVACGAALPAIYGLAAALAPKGRESETLGIVLSGWTISMIAGVSLSAVVADLLHWRAVFLGEAALAALVAGLLRRHLPHGEAPGAARSRETPLAALKVPGIGSALVVVAAFMTAFYGLYGYIGAQLTVVLGLSTASAGLAPLAYGIGFGGAVPFDRMIDRHGPARAGVTVFGSIVLIYVILAGASDSGWLLIGLCTLWGFVNHFALNLIVGRLTALDPSRRGTILGFYSAVTYLCVFAGTLAYGAIFTAGGFGAAALVSAALIAIALRDALAVRRRAAA